MLARLAENLFWAGRYIERAEDTARLLDVTYHGLLESPTADPTDAWREMLGSLNQWEAFQHSGRPVTEQAVTEFLVTDPSHPGSIANAVHLTRDNIRSLREQVSLELWEAVNGFHLELQQRNLSHDIQRERYVLYATVKQRCQTIAGVADQTMPRTDGWRFLALGRHLERAIMTCRLLSVYFHHLPDESGVEFHQWRNLLRAASAFEAYGRVRHQSSRPSRVIDFLLLDESFPRSVLFCLRSAETALRRLDSGDPDRPAQWALGRVRASLEYSAMVERLGEQRRQFVDNVIEGTQRAIEELSAEFFAPARPSALHAIGAI